MMISLWCYILLIHKAVKKEEEHDGLLMYFYHALRVIYQLLEQH